MLTHISKLLHTEYIDKKKKKKYSSELFSMFGDMKRGQRQRVEIQEERMWSRERKKQPKKYNPKSKKVEMVG